MVRIEFEYYDEYCRDGKWSKQSCECESLEECVEFYGLNKCQYRIISIEKV